MIGSSQFLKPPIKIGITKKKIITKAWAVTMTLYSWSSPNKDPGCPSSIRINILKPVPSIPLHAPVIKYKVPIFLWLQDQSCLERPVFRSSQIPPQKKIGYSGRLDPVFYRGGAWNGILRTGLRMLIRMELGSVSGDDQLYKVIVRAHALVRIFLW